MSGYIKDKDLRTAAGNLSVALGRIQSLADILGGVDIPDYINNSEIAEDVDALTAAIKAIAADALRENEI